MLNIDLVYNLYEGLTPERKEELLGLLFKKSRQTMAYFKRSKDISLSKLEILADFYHMPLDYFRTNSSFKTNNVSGNNNYVGNVSTGTNLLIENESLRKQISSLEREMKTLQDSKEREIETLQATITSKEDTNTVLKDHIDSLKRQLEILQGK